MNAIIVTTCTNRKRYKPNPKLCVGNLPRGGQTHVANVWLRNISRDIELIPAETLYCGRGFVEAIQASRQINAELWIISAGMGLVHGKDMIPSYNLTTSNTSDNVKKKITGVFDYGCWWSSMNIKRKRSLAGLITGNPKYTVFIILNQSYTRLVLEDLRRLSEKHIARIRLFGLTKTEILPEKLQRACMPYDSRLGDLRSGIPGTMSDLGQRAVRHFVTNIWPDMQSSGVQEHADAVRSCLDAMESPRIPVRKKMSDDLIREVMLMNWDRAQGSASKMLRILRDDEKIACQQKRCKVLFHSLEEEVMHVAFSREVSHTQSAKK